MPHVTTHDSQRIKGRLSPNSAKKFTDDEVREIREEHAAGATYLALAVKYGAASRTIAALCGRETYGWVR
jgi:hypothetical protein